MIRALLNWWRAGGSDVSRPGRRRPSLEHLECRTAPAGVLLQGQQAWADDPTRPPYATVTTPVRQEGPSLSLNLIASSRSGWFRFTEATIKIKITPYASSFDQGRARCQEKTYPADPTG